MPGRFEPYLFTDKTPYRRLLRLILLNVGSAVALTYRLGFHLYFWSPLFIQFPLLYILYRDLSTGRAWVRSDTFHRQKQPVRYWLSVVTVLLGYLAVSAWPILIHIQKRLD